MAKPQLLCLGLGYTAKALARQLLNEDWSVVGSTRDSGKAEEIKTFGAQPVMWSDGGVTRAAKISKAVLVSAPPTNTGCPVLMAAGDAIAAGEADWVGYLSSNGVYGDHGGEWVDEQSELRGSSDRAARRISAENAWRQWAENAGKRLHVFRLPGIYGPGRSAIDDVCKGTARRIYKADQVFSRMHVDDIAAALAASIDVKDANLVLNLADDEPAPSHEVVEFASKLLGVEPPPLTKIENADLSDMAKSFYADNKRVSNDLMKQVLGIRLAYPTYREGLDAILKNSTD